MSNARRHEEAHEKFNSRDWDGLRGLLDDGVVYEDVPRALTMKGADEWMTWAQAWATAFSNANAASGDYIDAGDWSIARFKARGKNDGPLGDMPATGNTMDMQFCELIHWTDGKMDRGEVYYDQVTMMTQLGVMEAAARS